MRLLLLALLLAGCAAPGAYDTRAQADLARDLAGRVAGPAQRCVSSYPAQSLRIVDSSTIVYESGRTLWVNRLDAPCPGLRPLETVIVEVRGAQYCRGDLVRGLPPGSNIAGPRCPLGDFIPFRVPR